MIIDFALASAERVKNYVEKTFYVGFDSPRYTDEKNKYMILIEELTVCTVCPQEVIIRPSSAVWIELGSYINADALAILMSLEIHHEGNTFKFTGLDIEAHEINSYGMIEQEIISTFSYNIVK